MKYLDISDKIANDNAPTTLRIGELPQAVKACGFH